MSSLLDSVGKAGPGLQTLLRSGDRSLSRAQLMRRVEDLADELEQLGLNSVALYCDNGIDWILLDLACQQAGTRIVPIPLFFSAQQVRHTILDSAVDALLTDQDHAAKFIDIPMTATTSQTLPGNMRLYRFDSLQRALIPDGTQKITFTSGTTGTPKGVCLSAQQQLQVAQSIATSIAISQPKHLCVLPLSTLLENVAGVYAPLMSNGLVVVPSLAEVGLVGSSELDVNQFLACIDVEQPNSLILVPELLQALVTATEIGWRAPPSLCFVAVGGGKVSPDLVRRARDAGIPVYEGYGLSECASVVTLNTPAQDRVGSVGRPLPHVNVYIDRGQIIVEGSAFLGYANQPESWHQGEVRTGDLGHIDDDGFVIVSGRAMTQMITSFGRNISPEWVESELRAGSLLQQVVVVGDGKPFCAALVWPRNPATTNEEIDAWLRTANLRLPDYARVYDWCRMPEPNSARNGRLTENGKLRRAAIEQHYEAEIRHMYAFGLEAINR